MVILYIHVKAIMCYMYNFSCHEKQYDNIIYLRRTIYLTLHLQIVSIMCATYKSAEKP